MSDFPSSLALTGGLPTHSQDYVASIVFGIAYVVLVPLAAYRCLRIESRTITLLRPVVFVVVRIATFSLRAYQAQGHYSTGYFTTEQILLLCGFVLICEPLLTLVKRHVTNKTPHDNNRFFKAVLLVLKIALLVALGLGVYAGTKFGDLDNPNTLKDVKDARDVNVILCAAISFLAGVLSLVIHFRFSCHSGTTLYLVTISTLLATASVYKIALYLGTPPNQEGRDAKIVFYCLSAVPEFLVTFLYLAINMNAVFPEQYQEVGSAEPFVLESMGTSRNAAYYPQPYVQKSSYVQDTSFGQDPYAQYPGGYVAGKEGV